MADQVFFGTVFTSTDDDPVKSGDVLVRDLTINNGVKRTTTEASTNIAGIALTDADPGHEITVATFTGQRVKVRVFNGDVIARGDRLVTSTTEGFCIVDNGAGGEAVVAIATQAKAIAGGTQVEAILVANDVSAGSGGGGGSGTLADAYNAGAVTADQTLALRNAKGGGFIVDGADAGFSGALAFRVKSVGGDFVVERATGFVGINITDPAAHLHMRSAGTTIARWESTSGSFDDFVEATYDGNQFNLRDAAGVSIAEFYPVANTGGVRVPKGISLGNFGPPGFPILVLGDGAGASVSVGGSMRARYNNSNKTLEGSIDAGPWVAIFPTATTQSEIAQWDPNLTRYVLVSKTGNDARIGFFDAVPGTSLVSAASTLAVATIGRAKQIATKLGLGRKVEIIIEAKNSGASYQVSGVDEDLSISPVDFSSYRVRGTATSTTAGCTAFDCSPADYAFLGAELISGTNVNGYKATFSQFNITGVTNASPIVLTIVGHGLSNNDWVYVDKVEGIPQANGHHKITVVDGSHISLNGSNATFAGLPYAVATGVLKRWKVTKADGSAPGFTDEDTSRLLTNKRIRFGSISSVPNTTRNVLALGADTLVPDEDLGVWNPSDVFYLEEPGVSFGQLSLTGTSSHYKSVALSGFVFSGLRCTALSVSNLDMGAFDFIHCTGPVVFKDSQKIVVTRSRFTNTLDVTRVSALSYATTGHIPTGDQPGTFTQCLGLVGNGGVFMKGLKLVACGQSSGVAGPTLEAGGGDGLGDGGDFVVGFPLSTQRPTRILGIPTSTLGNIKSGLSIAYSTASVRFIEITNSLGPAIGIYGVGAHVMLQSAYGTKGNTDAGVGFTSGFHTSTIELNYPATKCTLMLNCRTNGDLAGGLFGVAGSSGEIAVRGDNSPIASGNLKYSEFVSNALSVLTDPCGNMIRSWSAPPTVTQTGGWAKINATQEFVNDVSPAATISPYLVLRADYRSDTGITTRIHRVRPASADALANATGLVGVSVTNATNNKVLWAAQVGSIVPVVFDRSGSHPAPTLTNPPTIAYLSQTGGAEIGKAQADLPTTGVISALGPIVGIHPLDSNIAFVHYAPTTPVASTTVIDLDGYARNTAYASLFTNGTTTFLDDQSADPRPLYGCNEAPRLTLSNGTVNFTVGKGSAYAVVGGNDFVGFKWNATALVYTPNATGNPRIDLVLVDKTTFIVSVLNGTPAAPPQPPSVPAGKVALFEVFSQEFATTVDTAFWFRRLNRRTSFPHSQMWGILQGCNPAWSTANLVENADFVFREEMNSVVIDGEIVQGYGFLSAFNDSINPPTNTDPLTFEPFYIYVVGGSHNPMSYQDDHNYLARPAPLMVVFSETIPDLVLGCASANMNIASLGARGAINRLGCVYMGVGMMVGGDAPGSTLKMSVAYVNDWMYGRAFAPALSSFGATVTGTSTLENIAITIAHCPVTTTAIQAFVSISACSSGEHARVDLSAYSTFGPPMGGTLASGYVVGGLVEPIAHRVPGIVPLTKISGVNKVRADVTFSAVGNGAKSLTFGVFAPAVNMNVPRLAFAGQAGVTVLG